MNGKVEELMAKVRELEAELEVDLERKRSEFRYRLDNHRVRFERDMITLHRRLRKGSLRYILEAPLSYLLTAPVIYVAIVPLLMLDLAVSLYQAVCFPVYGIPRPKRGDYFIFDRHRLGYLNWVERLNCLYCSYANGLLAYGREIAARTEQFWCPIKHARYLHNAHPHYTKFLDYGDAERYRKELEALRRRYPELEQARTGEK